MKYRKWCIFAVLLLLIAALRLPVQATGFSYVHDEAMLLTTTKAAQLEETAAGISGEFGCGVYIVTVWDYEVYGDTVRSAAE